MSSSKKKQASRGSQDLPKIERYSVFHPDSKEYRMVYDVLPAADRIAKIFGSARDIKFIKALGKLREVHPDKWEALTEKLVRRGHVLNSRGSIGDYVREITRVYNHSLGNKDRIDLMV